MQKKGDMPPSIPNLEYNSKNITLSKHKPKNPTKQLMQSIAKDCFSAEWLENETELFKDLMSGERTHLSFDLPLKLRKAFKWATRRNKQTMCPVLQDFIMTYVAATKLKKDCFNNTMPSTIHVENLVIPSYERLKFRRHFEEDSEEERTASVCCGFKDCSSVPVAEGCYRGQRFLLCQSHFLEAQNRAVQYHDWSEVKLLIRVSAVSDLGKQPNMLLAVENLKKVKADGS